MLSEWACVQSSAVGQCEQQDVKNHQQFPLVKVIRNKNKKI